MRGQCRISVIIPAFNEERAIGQVISSVPDWVDDMIVADNGSTDRTVEVSRARGARVVQALRRGYGAACLAGMAALEEPDIVVFLDGDFSEYPEHMDRLVDPIIQGQADMVIGSRALGRRERGALPPQARFGNRLSCSLMRMFWKVRYTDLGPFRAISYRSLLSLGMHDKNYGWTVEMQIKGAVKGLRALEVPVDYRRRVGRSKVSGTLKGVAFAGVKILYTIFKSALQQGR